MKYDFSMGGANLDNMPDTYFLIGLVNRFNNSFQAAADSMFPELSWKQIFFMNCVVLFEKAPAIKDMAELLGCSHQNAKQIVAKLEKQGFARVETDPADKRRQRIFLTDKAFEYRREHEKKSDSAMNCLFEDMDENDLKTAIRVFAQLAERIDKMRMGEK